MAAPSEKQVDYALKLANQLTGERARYASQSSLSGELKVKTGAEASALIGQLQEAVEEHEKWLEDTGLAVGTVIRRHYTKRDGTEGIASGKITGYEWGRDLAVYSLCFAPDEATYESGFFPRDKRVNLVIERLGETPAEDPVAALEAERAKLVARIAEIDAELESLRDS